jgi:hypothetical protein
VVVLVGFSASFQISPPEFLFQMAAPSNIFWDHAGHLHTNALHWEGFPVSYGNHLVYSSTPSPHSTMEWSIERKVFPGAESR